MGTCTFSPNSNSQAKFTINSGAPDVYTFTVSGYVPAFFPTGGSGAGTCPAGTSGPTVVTVPSGSATTTTFLACQFLVSVQKKYVEITTILLTGTTCGGQVTYSEGLKSFFGPTCFLNATATGTTELKTGVDCASEPPAVASALPAEFAGTGATYSCVNGTLSVVGIPSSLFTAGNNLAYTYNVTGPGGINNATGTSVGGLCAGTTGTTSTLGGSTATLCSTGIGTGTVQACFAPANTVNTQPGVCSNVINFSFTAPTQSRVIPYVRWAGEKIVLTKCFGGAGFGNNGLFAGSVVEFNLQADSAVGATLIPAALDTTGTEAPGTTGPVGGGTSTPALAGSNTVYTVADQNGCATVIAYATNEGVVDVDAALYSTGVSTTVGGVQLVNEHAFEVYFLKFDHLDLENITFSTYQTATALSPALTFTSSKPAPVGFPASFPGSLAATFTLPNPPGTGQVAGGTYAVPICNIDYVRAMVHGYFEMPGDPSGRPASNVALTGASSVNGTGTAAAGSYVLPAGRWVLPEDWPVLATFAGFTSGSPLNITPSSVYAWDLNSGWVFNPNGENADLCFTDTSTTTLSSTIPAANTAPGPIGVGNYNTGPCYGNDGALYAGNPYSTAPGDFNTGDCASGLTVGIGPFDATQACRTDNTATQTFVGSPSAYGGAPYATVLQPPGSTILSATSASTFALGPLSTNSTYLPNGTLNEWDAPMPPAQVSFGITSGPGTLDQVNKTGLYALNLGTTYNSNGTVNTLGVAAFPDPFYSEAIPASPLIPPILNNGGYLWDTYGFRGGTVAGFTTTGAILEGAGTTTTTVFGSTCTTPNTTTITVTNGSTYVVGTQVYLFTGVTGQYVLLNITGVSGNVLTVTPVGNESLAFCTAAGQVLQSNDIGLTLPSASSIAAGSTVTVQQPNGVSYTASVDAVVGNVIYLNNSFGIASALGNCDPYQDASCITSILQTGTLVTTAASIGTAPLRNAGLLTSTGGMGPYPFWQWVGGTSGFGTSTCPSGFGTSTNGCVQAITTTYSSATCTSVGGVVSTIATPIVVGGTTTIAGGSSICTVASVHRPG